MVERIVRPPEDRNISLTAEELPGYMSQYAATYNGTFMVTLVKEDGQGYNAVLQPRRSAVRERLTLVRREQGKPDEVLNTWFVRDVVAQLFAGGTFAREVERTVDDTLIGSRGCVCLNIVDGSIAEAEFIEGELWP